MIDAQETKNYIEEQTTRTFIAVNALLIKCERNKKGGFAKVKFQLTPKVTEALGWPEMPEGTAEWCPDVDEIRSTLIELKPNNEELHGAATTVETTSINDFTVVRKKKKAGKNSVKADKTITEVLCKVHFDDECGCAKLEQYLMRVGLKRAEMMVRYTPQPVQDELPGTRVDVINGQVFGEVHATEEQRQAVLEMPVGEGPAPTHAEKVKARSP